MFYEGKQLGHPPDHGLHPPMGHVGSANEQRAVPGPRGRGGGGVLGQYVFNGTLLRHGSLRVDYIVETGRYCTVEKDSQLLTELGFLCA